MPRPRRSKAPEAGLHRILILGWSHKIASLVIELEDSSASRFDLTMMSRIDAVEREQWLKRNGCTTERVRIRHVQGDYSIESELSALDPTGFDHALLLSSGWMDSSEEADARTILGYVLLRSLLEDARDPPEILVELLDPDNAQLFVERDNIIVVSPRVLSDLLAHVALHPELNSVYGELFGAAGAELDLRRAADFGLAGRALAFPAIQQAAEERGCVALGLALSPGALGADDRLIVLSSPRPDPLAPGATG